MEYLAYLPDASFFEGLLTPAALIALGTLIVMELVLGIDNLVFVSIISNRVSEGKRAFARFVGLMMALGMRIGLLFVLAWLVSLTEPVITIMDHAYSWKDAILIGGGLFLVWKATMEMHEHTDPDAHKANVGNAVSLSFASAIVQITLLNVVFSVDSIITAVGMTENVSIMMIAVVVSCVIMLISSGPLGRLIERNPTIIMLALSFLLMIGMTLVADGLGFHIPKEYVYAMMGFSGFVEVMNLMVRRAKKKAQEEAFAKGAAAAAAQAPAPAQDDNYGKVLSELRGTVPADVDLEMNSANVETVR